MGRIFFQPYAKGIPWTDEKPGGSSADVSALAPGGLNMTDSDALPGDSLVALADRLNAAVVQSFKDGLYDECVVDMTPFGIEECHGRGGSRLSPVYPVVYYYSHRHVSTTPPFYLVFCFLSSFCILYVFISFHRQ